MRKLFIVFLILIWFESFSQESADSLKKYSYFTNGAKYEDTTGHYCFIQGTGFFIKQNGRKRYISAKHVLLNCNYNGEQTGCRPDKIMVFYNDNDKVRIGLTWRFDITKFTKTHDCSPVYKSPDTITVLKEDTNSIYSIEHLIPSKPIKSLGEIVIYGFPLTNNIKSGWYTLRQASKISSKDFAFDSSFFVADKKGVLQKDLVNYRLFLNDYRITPELGGFSGSPVFAFDIEDKRWYFLGILSAIDPERNLLFIVKAKYIIN